MGTLKEIRIPNKKCDKKILLDGGESASIINLNVFYG